MKYSNFFLTTLVRNFFIVNSHAESRCDTAWLLLYYLHLPYSFLDQLRWQLLLNPNEEQRRALKFETIFDLSFIFDRIRYQLFSFFPSLEAFVPQYRHTFFSLSTSWIMWLYWKTLFKETAKKSSSSFEQEKEEKSKINFTLRYFYTLFKNCDVLIALLGLGLIRFCRLIFVEKSKALGFVLDFSGFYLFFPFLFRQKIIIYKCLWCIFNYYVLV